MKFIHAADIHLDSPLIGLQFYEGALLSRPDRPSSAAVQAKISLIFRCVSHIHNPGGEAESYWG